MNTPNNKRRKDSQKKIVETFLEMMKTSELENISVTELCKRAGVNRTTFYACYEDVYDLAHKVVDYLLEQVDELYREEHENQFNSENWMKLLQHIYDHQLIYSICLKLGVGDLPIREYDTRYAAKYFDNKYMKYHIEFFRAGFNRILRIWLDGGCQETPEEINYILKTEYVNRPIA